MSVLRKHVDEDASGAGIITRNQIVRMVQSMTRWYFGPFDQKSTNITRTPLRAW